MQIKTTKQKQFIRYPGQPHAGMFMKVKLQLFADGANMISLYLKQFQTDNSMIHFVFEIEGNLIHRLMKIFIWKAIIVKAGSAYSLIKIDLPKRETHLPLESVKLPTATKTLFSSFKASLTKKLKFKEECAAVVKGIIEKLQERLPLKHLFVRSLSSLVPKNMVESKNFPSKFEKVIDKLYTTDHIN